MSPSALAAHELPPVSDQVPAGRIPPTIPDAWKNVGGYLAAVVLALLAMTAMLHLWKAHLNVPFNYTGDNGLYLMVVQNTIENGWYLDNSRLGAPGALDLRDYPMPDVLHLGIIKLLGYAFPNPAAAMNLYYLLAFPLTALTSYFVLRRFRLGRLAALVASVLYAFLPYHVTRFVGHIFLASYYLVPLMILVVVRVYMGRSPFLRTEPDGGAMRWRFVSWEAAGAVLVCVLTGLAGVYYAFFSCFLLLAAGAKVMFRDRKWPPVGAATLLILLTAGAEGVALAPSFLHTARFGKNSEAVSRIPMEAELYGIKVGEMLLPIQGHRLPFLARLREQYLSAQTPTGEVWSASLGLTASVGFLLLVGWFLWRRRDKAERIEDGLAYLTIAAVMLGTIGGVGCWFAVWVTPMIRCYNRISIFIAFFALAGLFLTVHRFANRHVRGRWKLAAYAASMGALLLLGVLDQTTPVLRPNYEAARREYASDADFGRRMEGAVPSGAMVYEMPYARFPESPSILEMTDYSLFRPFFHTRTLRWSYGAMAGRETSRWQADLAKRPLPEVVESIARAGFSGIYLDRSGLANRGAGVEAELTRLLGVEPLVSSTGGQSFFNMTAYVRTLRAQVTTKEWEAKRSVVLSDPLHK